jgi:hypothetical protein
MQRVHVSADSILEYVDSLSHVTNNLPTAFIWNIDEIGHSDRMDAHPEAVYLPAEFHGDFVLFLSIAVGNESPCPVCFRRRHFCEINGCHPRGH